MASRNQIWKSVLIVITLKFRLCRLMSNRIGRSTYGVLVNPKRVVLNGKHNAD